MDILDRLEAIIEDDFARSVPSSLCDELDSFFDKEELAQFKAEVLRVRSKSLGSITPSVNLLL